MCRFDERPWLLHWQFGLIYLGAALNKLLDHDWQAGVLMQHLLTVIQPNPIYLALNSWFPGLGVARLLSWLVILLESVLAVALVWPAWKRVGVWLCYGFHAGMFLFIFGYRFGYFFEAMLVGLICFLDWPTGKMNLSCQPFRLARVRRLNRPWSFLCAGGATLVPAEGPLG